MLGPDIIMNTFLTVGQLFPDCGVFLRQIATKAKGVKKYFYTHKNLWSYNDGGLFNLVSPPEIGMLLSLVLSLFG